MKGDAGICAVVREEERIDLREPGEQAFGQHPKVEVGIEGSEIILLLFMVRKNIGDWRSGIPLFSYWWNWCVDEF